MPNRGAKASTANKSQAKINCLVTGFDPFYGQPFNPSEIIARSMPSELVLPEGKLNVSVKYLVLPTIGNGCWQVLKPVLGKMTVNNSACVLIMMGLAAKRSNISLERFALNIRDHSIPDNNNHVFCNEKIDKFAPEAFRTDAPIEKAIAYLSKEGWPVEISNHGGTFICNEIYFRVLHYFASKKSKSPYAITFIHLPLPPSYGKILKEKGTQRTKNFSKGKNNQMKALFEVVKAVAEFNCEFLVKQMNASK